MNALKKSPVLNRQCLRNKIEELSPLVLQSFNKDTLFRATWNYYASGCQERLTSIRRRIEQNAKIVAPSTGPRTQLHRNRNLILTESSLPPGVDLENHIYHELVCCFRSSQVEDPVKAKKVSSVQHFSPEKWVLWKREELEVQHMLMQSKDPYRAEELTRKLQKLRKLTNRDPLIMLPCETEVPIITAPKKSKRCPFKEYVKQPGVSSKPGPYVNKSKEFSSTDLESTECTSSDKKSDKLSKRFDKEAARLRFKIESLSEDPEKHQKAKFSNNEKPKKLKSAKTRLKKNKRKNPNSPPLDALFFLPPKAQEKSIESMSFDSILIKKSSDIIKDPRIKNPDPPLDAWFYLPPKAHEKSLESMSFDLNLIKKSSEIINQNPRILKSSTTYPRNEFLRRRKRNKQQNRAHPFFLSHKPQGKKSKSFKWILKYKSAKRNKFSKMPQKSQFKEVMFLAKEEENQNDPALPVETLFFLPDQGEERFKETSSSRSTLKAKPSKVSQTSDYIEKSHVKIKIPAHEHPDPDERPELPQDYYIDENMETQRVKKLRPSIKMPTQSSSSEKSGYNSQKVANKTAPGRRSIRKAYSWHSQIPTETFIPFKTSKNKSKLSSEQEEFPVVPGDSQDTKRKSKFFLEMKHKEYFKPYGQFKTKGREKNLVSQVQMFPEIYWEKRKSSIKPVEELQPPEVRIPFMDSHFTISKQAENFSMSNTKTARSSLGSNGDLNVSPPMIMSNVIRECLQTYEPEICFRDAFANFMKHNMLDYPETTPKTIKKVKPKVEKFKKMKLKKKKVSQKVLKLPSKREIIPCSLCNLVRRRQSELRPYMKKMQEQRQRMELKAYYIQKMLKDRRCQEQDPQQVLAKCYQTLKLCQKLVELRQLRRSQESQS